MVTWDKSRVERYANQVLSSILAHPASAEELITIGLQQKDEDRSSRVAAWAERWADIAFDIAEVFAVEADQRDEDADARIFDYD